MVSRYKHRWLCNLKLKSPLLSEISIHSIENNDVNETGSASESSSPGRCSSAQQRGHGRQPAIARFKWSKEVNKVIMEYF